MHLHQLRSYILNLFAYFGASLIPLILNLVSNPWIAKNMSPEDYAITGYFTSFTSLISPIIWFYLIHYYIKEYFNKSPEARQRLYSVIAKALIWFSAATAIICFVILYIYLRYINTNLSFPISPYLALMVTAIPLTGLLNLQLAQYRMEKDSKSFFNLSVTNGVLNIILSVLLVVFFKWGALGKLLAALLCNLIIFLFLLFKFRSVLKIHTKISEFRPVFIFCLPLAISAMLGYFTSGFTTTYLESVGNVTEYGIYVVGMQIGLYLNVFATAISNTFQPDKFESIINRKWKSFIKYCMLQLGLTGFAVVIFIILAPYIISILTAGRYVSSTIYAQIIAISTFTNSIYYIINDFTIARNHPNLYLATTILGSLAIVILMPWSVSNWSFIGGSWMTVASFVLLSIINVVLLLIVRKKHHNPPIDENLESSTI